MRIRWLLYAVLAVGVALVPGTVRANTGLQTMGCAQQGYTLLLPASWVLVAGCSKTPIAVSPDLLITLSVITERHGYWTDARAKSSITYDLTVTYTVKNGGKVLIGPRIASNLINGRHFIEGDDVMVTGGGYENVESELETFAKGQMYKFLAIITIENGKPNTTNAKLVSLIWKTILIG